MNKIIASIIAVAIAVCAYAQTDVTKFLGIPVDGSKAAMIRKLKAKGFCANPYNEDVLEGTFNGRNVEVYVITNGNKVCRIAIADADPVDERSIQIRFNRLCHQFENNPKYITIGYELIPHDEDISYEILVNKKRYEAVFYQKPIDITFFKEKIMPALSNRYTPEQLANPTDAIKKDIEEIFGMYGGEITMQKSVWFMINYFHGKYYITMYYDNGHNQANGEDL